MEILSWNIQAGRGVDGVVDLGRIAREIRREGEPEVICLQEIARCWPELDDGRGEDQVAALAALFPRHEPFFGAAIDRLGTDGGERSGDGGGRRRRFGNLVLSRLPVEAVFRHPLPRPAEPGIRHMPRQATEVIVRAGGGSLRIVTTHLEFHARSHRLAQVERLLELHREACEGAARPPRTDPRGCYAPLPRPAGALLCGDFNFRPGEPEYEALLADAAPGVLPLADAWSVLHGPGTHRPTCGIFDSEQWPEGPHCRDFHFLTADLVPRLTGIGVDEETMASDHQPIRLQLEVPGGHG